MITLKVNGKRYDVVLIHFMREGDQTMPVPRLTLKYPYAKASRIVAESWK